MIMGLAKKLRDDERSARNKRELGMLVGMLRREFAQKGRKNGNRKGRGKKNGKVRVVAKAAKRGSR